MPIRSVAVPAPSMKGGISFGISTIAREAKEEALRPVANPFFAAFALGRPA